MDTGMKRTTLFCLVSAMIGALAATAYHQTASHRQAQAQERGSLLRSIETPPPPLPSARRPAPVVTGGLPIPAFGTSLDDFAPEERTNIAVYEKANRSVVHITTKSTQRELLI